MATNDELTKIYGELRSSLLARHFALGRYFRADHLALFNHLGTAHNDVQSASKDADTDDVAIYTHDRRQIKPTAYDYTADLQAKLETAASATTPQEAAAAEKILLERWRVGRHERENPLNQTGLLLTCLAVEYYLDLERSQARKRILEVLGTLASLCKFKGDHLDGYMIRWDPTTSDRWVTGDDHGKADPRYCCEFLVGAHGEYLYSTPLNDPRYTPLLRDYERQTGIPKDQKSEAQKAYEAARERSMEYYRSWEPSEDEVIGVLTGYDIVFRLVDDEEIRGNVRGQVKNLGDYLAESGYLLVRPGGGFTARGASGFSVALEYPFGRVFERITGDPYRARVGFEGALGRAGLSESLQGPLTWWTIAGIIGGAFLPGIAVWAMATAGVVDPVMISIVSGILATAGFGGLIAGRAAAIYLHRDVFDVWGNDAQGEFSLAYALKKLPIKLRFTAALWWLRSGGGCAVGFPPHLGLTGLDDSDQTVSDSYKDWFTARRQNGLSPFEQGLFGTLFSIDPMPPEWKTRLDGEEIPEALRLSFVSHNRRLADTATVSTKQTGIRWWIHSGKQDYVVKNDTDTLRVYEMGAETCFPEAVAVILGAGPEEECKLATLLQRKYTGYESLWRDPAKTAWRGDLAIDESKHLNYDTDDAATKCGSSGTPVALENMMPDLDFMAALALSWLHAKRQGAAIPAPAGFPAVPPSSTNWPPAGIPKYVYAAAASGNIALPLHAIPFDERVRSGDIDLFGGVEPPAKPQEDPPVKVKPEHQKQLVDVRQWTVRESDSVIDTGADILPEDTVSFAASGEIWAGVLLTARNGPNGWNKTDADLKFPLPHSNPYCLLARIGEWGSWMSVGTAKVYTHGIDGVPGRLYLRINDDKPGNGNGEFLCHIEVKR